MILFLELDARHDNQVLEDGLDLRTARPNPPTSQFRETNCPPRDILSGLEKVAVVRDGVQGRRDAGNDSQSIQSPAPSSILSSERPPKVLRFRQDIELVTQVGPGKYQKTPYPRNGVITHGKPWQ